MTEFYTRGLSIQPSTIDDSTRTVEVVWSTGAPVRRRDASGVFTEILSLDPAHVNLSRLNGASVLANHDQRSLNSVLGVVENARTDGTRGTATLRFSARPDVEPIWQDIRAGIIRSVSVGYSVEAWQDATNRGARTRTAVQWTPFELSLVPVPADPSATIRSGAPMNDDVTTADTPSADTNTRAAVNAEIRTIARISGLSRDFADTLIDEGADADTARRRAFEELAKRGARIDTTANRVEFGTDHDDPDAKRERMAEALACRFTRAQPSNSARPFMHHTALDMTAELLNARGMRVDARDRVSLANRLFARSASHTTSDFPLLLEAAANKMIMPRYQAAAPTYRLWAAERTFADFKPHKFLRIGDFPALQEVREGAEVSYGTISEDRETVTPKEYKTGFSISRRALINDDLRQLSEYSAMIAIRVAADENALVYGQIKNNGPNLEDGKALFHADHGNKAAAGTVLDVTNVAAAVASIRKMTSADGILLNIPPRFLVVGPDQELAARQFLAAITATKSQDVNPWAGSMELIVDANISGKRWYIFADPALYPTIAFGYLTGQSGPRVASEIDFDTEALRVRVGLDFGTGAIDWRGVYLNAGA